MSIRRIKRRTYRGFQARLQRRRRWYTAEDIEWDHMPPIGWEFGSPDYERLEREAFEKRQGR